MSASRAGFAASVAGALALALLLMRGQWHERPDLVRWFWIGAAIVFVVGLIAGGAMLTKAVRAGESGTRAHHLDDVARRHRLVAVAGLGTGQLRRHLYDPAAGLDRRSRTTSPIRRRSRRSSSWGSSGRSRHSPSCCCPGAPACAAGSGGNSATGSCRRRPLPSPPCRSSIRWSTSACRSRRSASSPAPCSAWAGRRPSIAAGRLRTRATA